MRPGYIKITKEHIKILKNHRERTGITEYALISYQDPVPWTAVSQWINGKIKSAKPEHLDFVINKWSKIPDGKNEKIELTDELKNLLIKAIGGRNRKIMFAIRDDLPNGFNNQVLSRMTAKGNNASKVCKKEYVDYVFKVAGWDATDEY